MAEPKHFWEQYSKTCLQNRVYPLRSVMRHLKGSEFALPVEAVRRDHWHYLLTSLSMDNSLTKVHFASCVLPDPEQYEDCKNLKKSKRDKGFPAPYGRSQENIRNISFCLAGLLQTSQTLMVLKLEYLTITCFEAKQLSIGLSQSSCLKLLSLAGCELEAGAIKIICDGLSRSCVTWLDLTCSVGLRVYEIEHVCDMIKAHGVRRGNELFPHTLRFKFPNLEELHGINRISLNFNYIPFEVIATLIDSLEDDLFIKALDFQRCGIDNKAAEALLHLATFHPSLEIIDLRLNDDIDESLLRQIDHQLSLNKDGKTQTYTYSSLWAPSEIIRNYNAIGKVKPSKRTSTYKFRMNKKASKSFNHSMKSSSIMRKKAFKIQDAAVQASYEMCSDIPENVQHLIHSLRITIHNEKKTRHYHETRCKKLEKENAYLKEYLENQNDDIYIDQETYLEIKNTFEKLKIFFDVMKKYGLWEYISMLGFDEYIDVIIKKNESLKCVTVCKKETSVPNEEIQDSKIAEEPCCDCRKMDSKHTHTESLVQPEDAQNYVKTPHNEGKAEKPEVLSNQRAAYKLLQEVMNDYNNSLLNQVYNHEKMTSAVNVSQGTVKQLSSKLPAPSAVKEASGADTLIRKFSYANMPEQVKDLVSPKQFYTILKKELERCVKEVGKTFSSSQTEGSATTSSFIPKTKVPTENPMPNSTECINKISYIPETKVVSTEKPLPNSIELNAVHKHKNSSSKLCSESSDEEIDENLTIHELLIKKNLKFPGSSKYVFTEKSAKPISTSSSSKTHKNINHAKIKETKSVMKSEQTLPRSKLKHLSSSQTSSKRVPTRSNVSSDEINSSDSVVTASDKLSTASSASSSSSSKSHVKPPLSPNKSKHQKSYIETVSDASTFKDVESISDSEVASQGLFQSEDGGKYDSKSKSVSSVKTSKDESANSQSSTLRRHTLKSKYKKADEIIKSALSVAKNASNKSDKLTNTGTHPEAKTKTANKHGTKNRPKSNSSKSSSIPSLNDITTVSSKSLNTDSMMKQITGSGDNSKVAN